MPKNKHHKSAITKKPVAKKAHQVSSTRARKKALLDKAVPAKKSTASGRSAKKTVKKATPAKNTAVETPHIESPLPHRNIYIHI